MNLQSTKLTFIIFPRKYVSGIMRELSTKLQRIISEQNVIYDHLLTPNHTANISRWNISNFVLVDPLCGKSVYCSEVKQQTTDLPLAFRKFSLRNHVQMTGMRWHASMCLHTHYDYSQIPIHPPSLFVWRTNFETMRFKAEAFSNQVNCGKHSHRTYTQREKKKNAFRLENRISI